MRRVSEMLAPPSPRRSIRSLRSAPYIRNYPRRPRRASRERNRSFFFMLLMIIIIVIIAISYLIEQFIQLTLKEKLVTIFLSNFFSRSDIQEGLVLVLGIIVASIAYFIGVWCENLIKNYNLFPTLPRRGSALYEESDYLEEDFLQAQMVRSRRGSESLLEEDLLQEEVLLDEVSPPSRRLPRPGSLTQRIEKIVAEKKQKFLNIPNISFQFANHERIKDFYDVYFNEPTIESMISEVSGEHNGNIKGSVPQFIEAQMQETNTNKWTSNIKVPTLSSNAMFLRYQRETIKREQATLGIEEVDIELTELDAFEDAIENIKERFGLEIDEAILSKHRAILKEKAADKTLCKLEQITGWILIEGKFKVEKKDDFYKCTYTHPVNNYLSDQIVPVTISILISSNSLEEHIKGNYAQSIGKSIPLTVYGQVWQPIDRQTSVWELQLTPLAVY